MARATTTKLAGQAATRTRNTTKPPPEPAASLQQKTAVVVIHGMGEQRPLETLKEFVETVYRRDLALASVPVAADSLLEVSIVPDAATGSGELRRITTLTDGPQRRTDFFEFYWADIMDGTPLDMVTGWIRTLLLRSPFRLPASAKVQRAWLILWILALLVLVAGFIAVHPDPETLQLAAPLLQLGACLAPYRPAIAGVLAVGGLIWLVVRLVQANWVWRDVALGRPMILLVAGLVLQFIPGEMAGSLRFWAAAITAGVSLGMNALVAPYAGDVVRYVRATPSTVERRRLVRERGLALLEALHDKRVSDPERAEGSGVPLYSRVVIVGHSLGSIVGYDILQMFWERRGPTHHQRWNINAPGVQEALKACDRHVKAMWDKQAPSFDPDGFAAARSNLFAVLAAQDPGWRISDFITLGSPLSHAEFLLVDSAKEVEAAAAERRFATAPPHPDPLRDGSMLYSVSAPAPVMRPARSRRTLTDPLFPHFAAQFAAVQWTNIHDESNNPLLGDLVSGSLAGSLGAGINDHNVTIRRPGWLGVFDRIFTHTQYWHWHANYRPSPAAVEAGEALKKAQAEDQSRTEEEQLAERQLVLWENVPEHIRLLRLALRLGP